MRWLRSHFFECPGKRVLSRLRLKPSTYFVLCFFFLSNIGRVEKPSIYRESSLASAQGRRVLSYFVERPTCAHVRSRMRRTIQPKSKGRLQQRWVTKVTRMTESQSKVQGDAAIGQTDPLRSSPVAVLTSGGGRLLKSAPSVSRARLTLYRETLGVSR